jgi:hypothetical protein
MSVTYFNKTDLVMFGEYLLSEKRQQSVSELNKNEVTHADVENFLETINFWNQ